MSFVYYCPFCDQKIACEDRDNGTEARCPACQRSITVRRSIIPNNPVSNPAPNPAPGFNPNPAPGFNPNPAPNPEPPRCDTPQIQIQPVVPEVKKMSVTGAVPEYVAPVHKKGVLAIIYTVCAVFHFFVAALMIIATVVVVINRAGGGVIAAVAGAAGISLLFGLIYWGIAQFFTYVSRISENSEAIRKLLEIMYRTQK